MDGGREGRKGKGTSSTRKCLGVRECEGSTKVKLDCIWLDQDPAGGNLGPLYTWAQGYGSEEGTKKNH